MADYVSYKVCKEFILSILSKANTLLAPWNTGLDDTYLTYPEDIGLVGMMLSRCCDILIGMEGDVREYLRDWRLKRHPDLPNVSQWDDYIHALMNLRVPAKAAEWQETKDMLVARDRLVEVCKRLRSLSEGIGAPHRAKLPTFHGEEKDRALNKVHVLKL